MRLLLGIVVLCSVSVRAQSVFTLQEFLAQVELAHPALRSAQFEPELAEAEIRNALGRFDPVLNGYYSYKDKSGTDKFNYLESSVEMPLDMVFGPKVKATYVRGLGTTINPEHSTSLPGEATIGFSMPLFQGIFTDSRRNQLRKAMLRPDIAAAQFRIERNNLLRAAAMKYWEWCEYAANVALADTLLAIAEQRLNFISRRARAGETARIDSVEVAQELLRRQGERLRALRLQEQAEIELSVFLWSSNGVPQTISGSPLPLPSSPTSMPDTKTQQELALKNRPELARVRLLAETARLDSGLAQEYLRPFIEAEAALASYDVSQISKIDYKVGVKVSQPLLFRQASAGAQVADITVQRADYTKVIVERTIEADAANSTIAIQRSAQRLTIATEEVRLAEQMLRAEQQKLDIGESTLLTLNLRERFYAEAVARLISARGDYARAQISLLWATGTI